MEGLKPFWLYYGAKWRIARQYPAPTCNRIIEPFAGAAGYALRYPDRDVLLVDKSDDVVDTWQFLISADPAEIRAMPDRLAYGQRADSFGLSYGAELLLRWRCNNGAAAPTRSASKWASKNGWNPKIRERIARQVEHIRHWEVRKECYQQIENVTATWFVDPPYQLAGKYYPHKASQIDFASLGQWCKSRKGQVIVCENTGADWLPFRHFLNAKANESSRGGKVSREAIWTKESACDAREGER